MAELNEYERRMRKREVRKIQKEAFLRDGVELKYTTAMRIWEKLQAEKEKEK